MNRLLLSLLLKLTGKLTWYGYLRRLSGTVVRYWNFGYLKDEGESIARGIGEESDRTHIGLYLATIAGVTLRSKLILEVGCGLGSGAEVLTQYNVCGSIVALDRWRLPPWTGGDKAGPRFLQADALHLPFITNTFDLVLSVESSHSFHKQRSFLEQTARILRNNGELLLADFYTSKAAVRLKQEVRKAGFIILAWEDLTSGVLRAIEHDAALRQSLMRQLVRRHIPIFLQPLAIALVNYGRYRLVKGFQGRELIYLRCRARKSA